jgi:hypothetical protein
MTQIRILVAVFCVVSFFPGCSSKGKHHSTDLPDPKGYNAHFGDMDAGGDGLVSWQEFKAHFANADPKVFSTVDLNKDGYIDHDEWHAFKEAHGLKHQK